MKRIFYIFIFLIGIQFSASAQVKSTSVSVTKIIKFYPNPATVGINFEFQTGYDKSYTIQLFNFMGKKVYEITNPAQRTYLSLSSFYRGVYIYQLRDRNGKLLNRTSFK